MKILDTSTFEKLTINPIKTNDLSYLKNNLFFEYEKYDLSKIKNITDLNYGDIVKTIDSNFWIYTDNLHVKKFLPFYQYKTAALLTPEKYSKTGISYLEVDGYDSEFPKYKDYPIFKIVEAYKTNINLDLFESAQDICVFFNKNKIHELL